MQSWMISELKEYLNIIATESIVAIGFTTFCPFKSGAEPWTIEELASQLPVTLFQGYKAPAQNYH